MRKKAGKRRRLASALDAIPGIGPKTRQLLLQHVGGPEKIQSASDAALLAIEGIGARHVRALRAHLARQGDQTPPSRSDLEHRSPIEPSTEPSAAETSRLPESEQLLPDSSAEREARDGGDTAPGGIGHASPGTARACQAPAG
jgi:hypothetical protein